MFKQIVIYASLFCSSQAFGWSAISLGGGQWAIICANGTAWSYSGSSAGLDVVGPALCPGGLSVPKVPLGKRVTPGLSSHLNRNVILNLQEIAEGEIQAAKAYPPHGYPCLGCAPCPGNPTEFCDIISSKIVVISPGVSKAPTCHDFFPL